MINLKKLTFVLVFCNLTWSYSQNFLKNIFIEFDETIGLNSTNLYNGKRYFEKIRFSENNHPYFKTANFTKGNVKYTNQLYYDIPLKYNILEDIIILNLPNKQHISIELIKEQVQEFKIGSILFKNAYYLDINNKDLGFIEQIAKKENISCFKKHFKLHNIKIKQNRSYNNFKHTSSFWIYTKNRLIELKHPKHLNKIFPKSKNKIIDFYKRYKTIYKKDPTTFYTNLFNSIDFSSQIF